MGWRASQCSNAALKVKFHNSATAALMADRIRVWSGEALEMSSSSPLARTMPRDSKLMAKTILRLRGDMTAVAPGGGAGSRGEGVARTGQAG